MEKVNATNFRKDLYTILENVTKYNTPINITTKNGNAVVISEDDYNSIMETLYLSSIPDLKNRITDGINAKDEEFEDFKW